MAHARHIGGSIVDREGGVYTVDAARIIANVAQMLAAMNADKGEIEMVSYYGAIVTDFVNAGREAERWAKCMGMVR